MAEKGRSRRRRRRKAFSHLTVLLCDAILYEPTSNQQPSTENGASIWYSKEFLINFAFHFSPKSFLYMLGSFAAAAVVVESFVQKQFPFNFSSALAVMCANKSS